MILSLYACLLGFMLDLLIGDPKWKIHPIRLIGKFIEINEKIYRKIFPDTNRGKLIAGFFMTITVATISLLVPFFLLVLANQIDSLLALFLESILFCFAISTKSLKDEAIKIYKLLSLNELDNSRKALSMIVGRDTENLSKEGVVKATIETVAENTTDGVIAPLLFMIIGGAPIAYFYKAVNTMDSMVGYKNEKYLYFGRYAAKLDDSLNYFPARIAARLMIAVSFIFKKFDGKNAQFIYKRDKMKHASPNSAHTEAVCAGALRIQLAGDATYAGVKYKKETIGNPIDRITPEHINLANKLMFATAGMALILFGIVKFLIIYYL